MSNPYQIHHQKKQRREQMVALARLSQDELLSGEERKKFIEQQKVFQAVLMKEPGRIQEIFDCGDWSLISDEVTKTGKMERRW